MLHVRYYFLLVSTIFFWCLSSQQFTLITTLYHENIHERLQEYITCLERNLAHPLIKNIHVVYDIAKDEGELTLLQYLQQKPVTITYVDGRPTYGYCFDVANYLYPHSAIIISNADIYFNETLSALAEYDLTNKFLACTRWDVQEDGSLKLFAQYKNGVFDDFGSYLSQDAWIFQTPLRPFDNPHFRLGTWACDGYIAYQAYLSGLEVKNPCLTLQCCHLHVSQVRTWVPQSIPGAKAFLVPWCAL